MMYYIIYGILYLISLLPFFVLYGFSNFVAFVMFNLAGYRKKIVLHNLAIAFPEKTQTERDKIAKQFYKNFIDTFLESIKLLSMSDRQIRKRARMNMDAVNELVNKGLNIQLHSGHQMNWEYANYAVGMNLNIPMIGVYMKISNPALNKIYHRLRSKKGTRLVSSHEFKFRKHEVFEGQYALGLVADQNPGKSLKASWLYFFNQPAPFVNGPDVGARKNNTAVVFVKFVKKKRGYYEFIPNIITEEGGSLAPGELTLMYRDFLEQTIREQPDNYLWSHRRWKHRWRPEAGKLWIDKRVAPPFPQKEM